jgi:hypothetical protein
MAHMVALVVTSEARGFFLMNKKEANNRGLRDPVWQFIGALIGAVTLFATFYFFFVQREVKSLQVVILSNTSLVEVEQSIASRIKIMYEDQSIANLSLFQVKLENNGNQIIREVDYVRPIKFVFPTSAEVIEATLLDSDPRNIGITLQKEQNTVVLLPFLLNAKERIIIRLLVINMPTSKSIYPFEVDARIAGIKDVARVNAIEERSGSSRLLWPLIVSGIITSLLGSATAMLIMRYAQKVKERREVRKFRERFKPPSS